MEYGEIWIVTCNGDVVYSSNEEENAEDYMNNHNYTAREEVLAEWDIEDATEINNAEADFQAGYDGNIYEVIQANISGMEQDEFLTLEDGTEIEISEILRVMDKMK